MTPTGGIGPRSRRRAGRARLRAVRPSPWCLGSLAWLFALLVAPAAGAVKTPPAGKAKAEAPAPPLVTRTLIVGTNYAPPFSIRNTDGTWSGLSFELWREMAEALKIRYEIREFPFPEVLTSLAAKKSDLVVAALSPSAEREKLYDFTHPFHTSGFGIAVQMSQRSGTLSTLRRIFSLEFFEMIGLLVAALFLVGLVVWLVERRRNPAHFGGSVADGIGSGFWFSAVTLTTVGYGDKAPVTFWGRVIATLWMFAGVAIVAAFTGALASLLTVKQLEGTIHGPEDLKRARVGVPSGSSSADHLLRLGIGFRSYPSTRAAVEAVVKGELDAAVSDAPILSYLATRVLPGQVRVLEKTFGRQDYAFALPNLSPLREALNRALLHTISRPRWQEQLRRYLGSAE